MRKDLDFKGWIFCCNRLLVREVENCQGPRQKKVQKGGRQRVLISAGRMWERRN